MNIFYRTILAGATSFAVSLVGAAWANAYVASSSSYRLQSDSINIGGVLSSSTSYRMQDTIGEAGTGTSTSAIFGIRAGYQQMQETYLSITPPGNLTLSPSITTAGGGLASTSGAWTVITDNTAGYTMTLKSSSSPALVSGVNSFADYVPSGANPDFTWTVGVSAARFGYSAEGVDIVPKFKDNGVVCNAGSADAADRCWKGLSTTAEEIARKTSANQPSGTVTTLKFRAESGSSNVQPAGTYTATATLTVLAL